MGKYLFETSGTIEPGHGFSLFGPVHLIWLAFFAALSVILILKYRKWDDKKRHKCLVVITCLLLADELMKYIATAGTGRFELGYLPLHACSINLFVASWYTFKPSDIVAEALYAECLPGAIMALLFPSWAKLPPLNIMHIHSFTVHILLALYPMLLLAGGFKPNFKRLTKALPAFAVVAAAGFCFKKVFGTNFMFLNGGGSGNPLAWAEVYLGNPGYMLIIPVLLAIIWGIMYGIPALLRKRGKNERNIGKSI